MIRFLALTAVFLGVAAAPALAQEPGQAPTQSAYDTPAFQAFLHSDYANRLRREALQRSMVLNQPECVEEPDFQVTDTWPVTPIIMNDGDIAPTSGMWRERVESTACEETATENMVHTFTADGERTFLLVRGTTEADLETQFAIINDARDAAAADDNASGCDIIRFTDTSVSNRYNDGRWRERWVADACGHEVDLDIVFEPREGQAASYTISAAS
jgi:hypothetical protein